MDRFINLRLLMHPVNWAIVFVVLMFAGFAWAIVHEHVNTAPSVDNAA